MVEVMKDKRNESAEVMGTIDGLLDSFLDDPQIAEDYLRKLLKDKKESFDQLHKELTVRINTEESLDNKIDMQTLNALFVRIENNPKEEMDEAA